jgi:galactokinase
MINLNTLYADTKSAQARYNAALAKFDELFSESCQRDSVIYISSPGRTEIGGNHTDHQRGQVLAAAIDLDIICVVAPISEQEIRITSEGYPPDIIKLNNLNPRPEEVGTAAGLIRGVAEWFKLNGYKIGGLCAYTDSQVIGGSGLSSSAAFEVAVGNMLNHLYNDGKISPRQIALMGQYAENTHFGKPSGLMDQMASSIGGLISMDFRIPGKTVVKPIDFDFAESGYSLCITDTRGSHAGLTDEYTAITVEMGEIAEYYGKSCLIEVNEEQFYADIPKLYKKAGGRAVLRAMHFFDENRRVGKQCDALTQGDFPAFLALVNQSGESSYKYLQNVCPPANPKNQELALALAISKRVLKGQGACRVHGGGFAGTVQAFVPDSMLSDYRAEMNRIFGMGACGILRIRSVGGCKIG